MNNGPLPITNAPGTIGETFSQKTKCTIKTVVHKIGIRIPKIMFTDAIFGFLITLTIDSLI